MPKKTAEEMRTYHREYARQRRATKAYQAYQKQYHANRYEENRETIIEQSKQYYLDNKEELMVKRRAYQKAYRARKKAEKEALRLKGEALPSE